MKDTPLPLKVLEESDVMRATDRLVDRIREYQQMKVFVFQLVFLVITVGVLLNIIASLIVESLLREMTTSALHVLAIALLLVFIVGISTYLFSRRYFGGGLSTFVRYAYTFQPMIDKTKAVDIAKDLWKKVDPERKWKTIYGSPTATIRQWLVLLRFQSKSVKEKEEPDKYWIHLEGEFAYISFLRFRDRFLRYDIIEVPNVGKTKKICTCKISVNLIVEKKEDKYFVELNVNLELEGGIGPRSDELIQDVSVFLRSLAEELRRSLLKASNEGNTVNRKKRFACTRS